MNKYNKNIVSNLIIEYQKEHKNYTVLDIAQEIGVAKSTLYSDNPTIKNLIIIANFFKISVKDFFELDNKIGKNYLSDSKPKYGNIKSDELEDIKSKLIILQDEYIKLQSEKTNWQIKCKDLEIENERIKNTYVDGNGVKAG